MSTKELKRKLEKLEKELRKSEKLFIISSNTREFFSEEERNMAKNFDEMKQKVASEYGCESYEELGNKYEVYSLHYDIVVVDRDPESDEFFEMDPGDGNVYYIHYLC